MCLKNVIMRFIKILRSNFASKVAIISVIIFYFFGVFTLLFEETYEEPNDYVISENITRYILQLERNQTPELRPFNFYNYSLLSNPYEKFVAEFEDYPLKLVYIIKSAPSNFDRREAIRNSWGFERRFSDVHIKTVFILGVPSDESLQSKIYDENKKKGDIVQAAFKDSYYNNTIKTMVGIKWAVNYCNNSQFYFFSDDDMYVSTKNVLKFLRNPLDYPGYLEVPFQSVHRVNVQGVQKKWPLSQVLDIELPKDAELFAGYVFPNSKPHRHFFSRWYISLKEYPFSRYPPYVTAGAYVLSKCALKKFFYASLFVRHFRFDDIYLSLLARASQIVPLHSSEFFFYKKSYDPIDYKYVVASHGYSDPSELLKVWHEQKSAGNA